MWALEWGGTQLTWLRLVLAGAGEVLLLAYFLWVLRSVGK
jgi:hypothetical protein